MGDHECWGCGRPCHCGDELEDCEGCGRLGCDSNDDYLDDGFDSDSSYPDEYYGYDDDDGDGEDDDDGGDDENGF